MTHAETFYNTLIQHFMNAESIVYVHINTCVAEVYTPFKLECQRYILLVAVHIKMCTCTQKHI